MEKIILLATIIILLLLISISLYQYKNQYIFIETIYKYCITTYPVKKQYIATVNQFINKIIIKAKSYDANEIITELKIGDKNYNLKLLNNENYLLTFKTNGETINKQKITIMTDVNTRIYLTISTLSL